MIQKFTKIALPVLLLMLFENTAFSQDKKENPITTAVPFLRLAADARTGAMGDVGVATNPDANSIFINGGKTAFNESKSGIGLTYTPYLNELDVKNLNQISLAAFYKLNDKEAISVGFRNFNQGTFTETDAIGQTLNTFRPQDLAVEAGYSRKLSEKLGLGLSVRYISSNLAKGTTSNSERGNSVAADLSAFFKNPNGFNFGIALTNLGSKIEYGGESNYIPATFAIGTAYNKKINEDNKITFGLDITKLMVPTPPDPNDAQAVADYNTKGVVGSWFSSFGDAPDGFSEEIREFTVGLGTEYMYKDQFAVRAGYFSESKLKGNRQYFTTGLGLTYKVVGVNFSYLIPTGFNASQNALKNTLRLSLLFNFNDAKSFK